MEEKNLDLPKLNGMTPVLPPVFKRYSKDEFKRIIEENFGIVTIICNLCDCTYSQFHQAVKKWELKDFLLEQKRNLVSMAERVVMEKMNSQNENIALKAAEMTLRSQFARENGWGETPQVQIQQNILSDKEKTVEIKNIFGLNNES